MPKLQVVEPNPDRRPPKLVEPNPDRRPASQSLNGTLGAAGGPGAFRLCPLFSRLGTPGPHESADRTRASPATTARASLSGPGSGQQHPGPVDSTVTAGRLRSESPPRGDAPRVRVTGTLGPTQHAIGPQARPA
jgi:hypothetical protein